MLRLVHVPVCCPAAVFEWYRGQVFAQSKDSMKVPPAS